MYRIYKSVLLVLILVIGSVATGALAADSRITARLDGESTDDSHEKWIDVLSLSRIEAPQGVPEGTAIVGNALVVHDGYKIKRISDTETRVMKRDGSVTGTVTCDPCAGKGACTLSSSGGKLGCASSCDKGCVTVIKIPLPKAPAQQLQQMR